MAADRAARTRLRRRLPALLVRLVHIEPITGIGASTWERYDAAGLVPPPVRVGGCKLWGVAELRAWAAHGCPPRAEWQPLWQQFRCHAAGDRHR